MTDTTIPPIEESSKWGMDAVDRNTWPTPHLVWFLRRWMYGMKLEPYDTYSLASALLRERVGEQMALTMILGDAATRKDADVSVAAGKPSPANDYRMSDGRPIFGEDSPHDIGKHLAEVCQGEIPVNRDLLRAAIYADIDHGITGTIPSGRTKNDLTDSIMGTIAPFLASPEPVSSDPENYKDDAIMLDPPYGSAQQPVEASPHGLDADMWFQNYLDSHDWPHDFDAFAEALHQYKTDLRANERESGERTLANAVLTKIAQWGSGELDEDQAIHQIETLAIKSSGQYQANVIEGGES